MLTMPKSDDPDPLSPAPRLSLACGEGEAARDAVPVAQFTSTMSALAASVTLVTAEADGERHGRTVTAMLSLSASPPSVLVSITRDSLLARAIDRAQAFSVSVLAEDQHKIADAFAGFGQKEKFIDGIWDHWPSGQPRLSGTVASLDCRLGAAIELDTHVLYAGIVLHTRTQPDLSPLLWHRRYYAGLDGEKFAR